MASIPLFTGVADLGGGLAGVRPDTDQIARLDPSLYGRGASDARFAPSTAGAIANAATQGVETYQRTTLNNQAIRQNEAILQQQPQRAQLEEAKLQEAQAQLAEQVKLRQRTDQLTGIFQTGSPEQKVAAVTSGEFADVFAKDPRLEQYAIKVAVPHMSDEQVNAFANTKQYQAENERLRKKRDTIVEDFDKSEATLLASSDVNQILTQNPDLGYSLDKLVDRIEIRPAGEFKRDADGKIIRENGKPVRDPNFGQDGSKVTYEAVDKATGRVVLPHIGDDTRHAFQSHATSKIRLKRIGAYDNDRMVDAVKVARGQKVAPDMSSKPENQKGSNLDAVMATGGSRPQTAPVDAPKKALTTPEFGKSMQKVPAETENGRISFQKSPALTQLASQTLGLPPEVVDKKATELAQVLDTAYQPLRAGASLAERREMERNVSSMKENFVRGILAENFRSDKSAYRSYNEARVREHNAQIDSIAESIGNFAQGDIEAGAPATLVLPSYLGEKVQTPEELYIQENYERVRSRLDSVHRMAELESRRRATAKVRKGEAATNALAVLAPMIGG